MSAAATATRPVSHIMKLNETGAPRTPQSITYPFQMAFHGGAVLASAAQHAIYVNCTAGGASCWNYPMNGLSYLNASSMVHIVDQYANSTANNRYPYSTSVLLSYTAFTSSVSESDILGIIHASIAAIPGNPTGYANVYHVFLPAGYDTCIDPADGGGCYSPDNLSTFSFCAYHGSATFTDYGHVIFTVEPYQNVLGCEETSGPLPNGMLTDSTASTLTHEFFETVSDPDPGSGYYNDAYGTEMGDACQPYEAIYNLAGVNYQIQKEYSNADLGCGP